VTAVVTRPLSPTERDAALRWKLGHHTFHVLLVAMNTRLEEASRHLEAGAWPAAVVALDDLSRLYDGATAVMRYAADFRPEEYDSFVRPSMMPPFVSPGFSGAYNREHERMLAGVLALRSFMKQRRSRLPDQVVVAWERLWEAQRANRDNHMFVCRRFVAEGRSLLMEFFRKQREADRR
jgi:tryptophan 2,3-dioxygenase